MAAARLFGARLWTTMAATSFVLVFPLAVRAQPAVDRQRDVDSLPARQYLQQLSDQLDRQAARARADAKADERHRGSEEFAERLDDFAKQAHRFRVLVEEPDIPSSRINDELRTLVDDGRKVQQESANTERRDPRTEADWNRALATLNQMDNGYLAAGGERRPGDRDEADERWRQRRNAVPLGDLDRRSADAVRLSESAQLEMTPDLERLRDQVRSFEQNGPRLTPDDRRARLEQMLSEAREAQADLSGSNAPRQLDDDVDAIIDTLTQLRDSERTAVGTSGYGPGVAPGVSGYAGMSVPRLVRELDNRVARAADVAGATGSEDVSNRLAGFSDRVRDFDNRAASMSPEDRHETVEGLLQDAQNIQRDLATRRASDEVVSRWNDVVSLLAYLRDQS